MEQKRNLSPRPILPPEWISFARSKDELNTGRYQAPSKVTWAQFKERYTNEHLASLAPGTQVAAKVSLDYLEREINPDRLAKLTSEVMSQFQAKLRKGKMKDTTIARHLRHIRAALSWGVSVGMLAKVPDMHMPKRAKGMTLMRGRPITAEEYDRMVEAVPKVRPRDPEMWVRYLKGLWLSGLRLEESLALSWDLDAPFMVDLSGRRPAFRIYCEAQKSHQDQMLPMTPDFATWLLQTPPEHRHGPVFKMLATWGKQKGHCIPYREVGRIVSLIGKKAGVVVNKAEGKHASAHDLRRAFGTRWASRVKPATLQLLMRHRSIETTLKYYVAQDAADVADELWAAFGERDNNCDNIDQKQPKTTRGKNAVSRPR